MENIKKGKMTPKLGIISMIKGGGMGKIHKRISFLSY